MPVVITLVFEKAARPPRTVVVPQTIGAQGNAKRPFVHGIHYNSPKGVESFSGSGVRESVLAQTNTLWQKFLWSFSFFLFSRLKTRRLPCPKASG